MALCFLTGSERKLLNWLQENIEKFMMLSKRRRWNHSSREKPTLVSMSASWFLVSTYLIWIFGSKLILSNNQSSATLWVLDTCLVVGLRPLMIILMTASLSSKMYNWDWLKKSVRLWVRSPHLTIAKPLAFSFQLVNGFLPCTSFLGRS